MKRLLLFGLIALVAGACSDNDPVGVTDEANDPELTTLHLRRGASQVAVMTRNMYVGAPVEPVLAETDPNMVPVRVAEAWAALQATDFPTRARLMAAEIGRTRPHLIGLQEVTLLRSQFPSDVVQGNLMPNATEVEVDFLATLLDELRARRLNYAVAAQVQDIDVEVPRFDGVSPEGIPSFTDIRLTDSDVILVRGDVEAANPAWGNYAAKLPAPAGFEVPRGWAAVDATIKGTTYRFVNTHFESDAEIVRFLQAQELIGVVLEETKPTILVGDLNTGPGRPPEQGGQETYDFLVGVGGFTDIWAERRGRQRDGFTCCHEGDLSNLRANFTERIDLVLVRNFEALLPPSGRGIVLAKVLGDEARVRRRAGVWPSDHGGVFTRMIFPKPRVRR